MENNIEEKAFNYCYSDIGIDASRYETFKAGYTICTEDVVKVIEGIRHIYELQSKEEPDEMLKNVAYLTAIELTDILKQLKNQ